MTPSKASLFCRDCRVALFGVALLILGATCAFGQGSTSSASAPPSQLPGTDKSDKDDRWGDFGSHEAEMRARLILKAEKSNKNFESEDSKKLERLEKLTKRIRNEAGGSDSDPDNKDLPAAMNSAMKQLVDLADDLRKLVEKTPRHVVSAAVIDQANKLIGLTQHVRALSH